MHLFCWDLSLFSAVGVSRLTGLPEDTFHSYTPRGTILSYKVFRQYNTLPRLPESIGVYRLENHNNNKVLRVFRQHCSVRLSLSAMCTDSSGNSLSHTEYLCILTALLAVILEVGIWYPNCVQFLEDENFFMTPTGSIYVDIPTDVLCTRKKKLIDPDEISAIFSCTYLLESLSGLISQFVVCYVRMFYYRKASLSKTEMVLPQELEDLARFNDALRSLNSLSRGVSTTMLNVHSYMQTPSAQSALEQMEIARGIERDRVLRTTQLHRAIKMSDIPGVYLYSRIYGGLRDASGQTGLHYLAGLCSEISYSATLTLLPLEVKCKDRTGCYAGSFFLQLGRYEEASLLSFFEPVVDDEHNSILTKLIDNITTPNSSDQAFHSTTISLKEARLFSSAIKSQSYDLLVNLLSNQLGIRGAGGRTALIAAVQGERKEFVTALVPYESKISDTKGDGYALSYAMYMGNTDLVGLLAPWESHVLLTAGFTDTMISAASPLTHDSDMSRVLKTKELCKSTSKGWTALMFAAVAGNLQAVKQLAHSEAGLTNNEGKTAGTLAYFKGHVAIAEWLAKFETVRDDTGDTMLHRACRRYIHNPTDEGLMNVRFWLSMVNEYTEDGELAISLAIKGRCAPLINLLDLEYRARLPKISYFNGTSQRIFQGVTPLMLAALLCFHELPDTMITASTGIQDDEGFTALMCAARSGCIELVQRLIPYEGRMQTKRGFTALMCAAQEGHVCIVQMLSDIGHESTIQDINGNTALFRALHNGHNKCSEILLSEEYNLANNSGVTMLMIAVESTINLSLFNILISPQYKQLRQQQVDGKTALMCAASVNNISAITAILQVGQSGEIRMQDEQGFTALMYAAAAGHAEACNLLASSEGGMQTHKEQTAAMLAAELGHLECLSILLPIERALKKSSGWSLVHSAAIGGSIEILNIIDPTFQELTEGPEPPLLLAKKHLKHEIVNYIEAYLQK